MRTDISKYSLHDYSHLIREWKALAKESGLKIARIGKVDGFPIFKIYSSPKSLSHCIYLSAGIHGDEPAGCHGLLQWARLHLKRFSRFPIHIFPCLNPWGLVNNQRLNSSGIDLNRAWGSKTEPLILCMHQHLEGLHFCLSLHLHEDFDGQGIYLYEPKNRSAKGSIANEVLDAAAQIIARDPRAHIDGRKAEQGIIRPRANYQPAGGLPEALFVLKQTKGTNLTLESPSEWGFTQRIEAQAKMVNKAVELSLKQCL